MTTKTARAAAVEVLTRVEGGLSALIAPLSATEAAVIAARRRLLEYESALGLKPEDTDTIGARIEGVKAAAARGLVSDLEPSLAALQKPAARTLRELDSAGRALWDYEQAFQIRGVGTYGERIAKVRAAAEKALARNLPQPLPTSERDLLSDTAIAERSAALALSIQAAGQLGEIARAESATRGTTTRRKTKRKN